MESLGNESQFNPEQNQPVPSWEPESMESYFLGVFGADGEELGRPEAAASEPAARVPSEGEAGGCPSNTHLPSSQVSLNGYPEYKAAGDFDWFGWSAILTLPPDRMGWLFTKLDELKLAAQEAEIEYAILDVPGFPIISVSRTGFKPGGIRGNHYDFKLDLGGTLIGLAKRDGSSKMPNMVVVHSGRDCLLQGAREAYLNCRKVFESLGGIISNEKISRIDVCLDIVSLEVSTIQALLDQNQFVTRARCIDTHGEATSRNRSTICYGKSPIRIMIYDKLAEQRGRPDALYLRALMDRRYGGSLPDNATRIEIEIGRSWLKDHGINSPEDAFQRAPLLIDYVTSQWFRLTCKPVDREGKHQSIVDIHPLWVAIREAFFTIYGQSQGKLARVQRELVEPVQMVKQAIGCLRYAVLQIGHPCRSFAEFVAVAIHLVWQVFQSEEQAKFMQDFQLRETRHRT